MNLLDQLDDFWRDTLQSGVTNPKIIGKKYNDLIVKIQGQVAHLPQEEQDQLVWQLVNRNAEYIAIANKDKDNLRVRLGLPPLLNSGNRLAQVAAETAVRATVWQS